MVSKNSSFGLNIKYFSSIEALEIPLEVNILNLGYNSLSKVPSFEKFPNLVELDLSGNDFEQILDSEFKTLPRLSFKLTPKITTLVLIGRFYWKARRWYNSESLPCMTTYKIVPTYVNLKIKKSIELIKLNNNEKLVFISEYAFFSLPRLQKISFSKCSKEMG